MLKTANEGYTTATDFADYLVKEKKLTFRVLCGCSKISELRRKEK